MWCLLLRDLCVLWHYFMQMRLWAFPRLLAEFLLSFASTSNFHVSLCFFQIKINHRFEPHRYHFRMVADPVRQHGPRGITIWFKIWLEKFHVFTIIVFFSVLKFVFFCFYFELLRYRRSSLRGVVAQDSPKDRHEIFDKMQRIFEQSSSRSFSNVFLRFFLRRLP